MKEEFLKLDNHNDLASFFGLTYTELAKLIYRTSPDYKYHQFQIPKKGGGHRDIKSPSKKLKQIQSRLKDALYEIYPTRAPVHGFAKGRSIVTNAEKHLDKRYVFNLDIHDFFGSIHFGRIRNLYKARPFNFNNTVATILTQISCFDNSLPQGAPTSPILSNMITWKLDSQLQQLAKITNCTYTRYVDDISFSFTCNLRRIPEEIAIVRDREVSPGHAVTRIIEENGFNINYQKVRFSGRNSRMEVTGLTVNEFPNVRRTYVKQLSSMLHAWKTYGYDAAEREYNDKYRHGHRASSSEKSFLHVVKGKLAFLRSVRSVRCPIFNKYADWFNQLVEEKDRFFIPGITDPELNAINSLWVVEACYDDPDGEAVTYQGTGFQLNGVGLVTCAHVVNGDNGIFTTIEAYKYSDINKKYAVKVERMCTHRDVAICSVAVTTGDEPPTSYLDIGEKEVKLQDKVKLLGFPSYAPGHSYYLADSAIAKTYVENAVRKFEIDKLIRGGNSGGPIINDKSNVIGIALKGTQKDEGKNACLAISEINDVVTSDQYKI